MYEGLRYILTYQIRLNTILMMTKKKSQHNAPPTPTNTPSNIMIPTNKTRRPVTIDNDEHNVNQPTPLDVPAEDAVVHRGLVPVVVLPPEEEQLPAVFW